jgi:phosphopantothenoylcysteine decarboxylase/phosphopantothenate--cysteine ligase
MPKGKSKLESLSVLLGVSGGVAVYKAVDLASSLTGAGAKVRTVMTENACRLVGPKSFEAVTQSAVYTDLWGSSQEHKIGHITLAEGADVIVVAPATANIIAKLANGICDDLLSTVLCTCWAKPVLVAPAMNSDMWNNPAVRRNIQTVKKMGVEVVGPEKGRLACGTEGIGRMSEPQDILEAIGRIASKVKRKKK